MSAGNTNREEFSEEWTPFPFLRLPAEIRNEIYRLILLTKNVVIDKPNTNHPTRNAMRHELDFFDFSDGADGTESVELDEVAVGTIRCQSWRTYRMKYQIAILLTNRQTYRDTWGMFQLENMWALVHFNKANVGKEMKDNGFPVASGDNIWLHVKFPVMKVTVVFPGLEDQKQSDTLVVATIYLKQLVRALWTAKGASEMDITIYVQPPHIKNPPDERYFLEPFFQLRSIKRLVVLGMSEQEHIDDLTRAITTTDGINQRLGELATGIKRVQQDIEAERWEPVIAQAEKNYILLADSKIAYEDLYSVVDPSTSTNSAIVRNQVAQEIVIAIAIAGAQLTFHSGDYASSIDFVTRTFTLISRAALILQHITTIDPTAVVVHPSHQLPSLTGIMTHRSEVVGDMSTQKSEAAFTDIEIAGKPMPNSVKVALASQDWQALFGEFPDPGGYVL